LYRTKEEIEDWKEKDPIVAFEHLVEQKGVLTRAEIDEVSAKMREQIRDAIKDATTAPDSDPAELLSSVFRQVNP
jgi:pyruvate dehydrogenase E1 component alpha subunit